MTLNYWFFSLTFPQLIKMYAINFNAFSFLIFRLTREKKREKHFHKRNNYQRWFVYELNAELASSPFTSFFLVLLSTYVCTKCTCVETQLTNVVLSNLESSTLSYFVIKCTVKFFREIVGTFCKKDILFSEGFVENK